MTISTLPWLIIIKASHGPTLPPSHPATSLTHSFTFVRATPPRGGPILMDDNFNSIVAGVRQGRLILGISQGRRSLPLSGGGGSSLPAPPPPYRRLYDEGICQGVSRVGEGGQPAAGLQRAAFLTAGEWFPSPRGC